MADSGHLEWPYFDERHRELARTLEAWSATHIPRRHGSGVDAECRALVKSLGAAGWLHHAVGGKQWGASELIDTRAICLIRETLAGGSGLADFVQQPIIARELLKETP